MADLPTVLCYGDSNTHGADGTTGRRHPRDASDGVHLDAAAHVMLGMAIAAAVAGLLPGPLAPAR